MNPMTQAARTDTTPAISIADLTVKDGDERVSHKRLAEALGMNAHWVLRQLVERNIVEFQRFGEVSSTALETASKGGRPGKLLWLNEGQAILAAVRSDAPRAAEVRYQVITAFMAYRHQQVAKPVHVREHDRRTSTTIDKAVSLKRSADRLEAVADKLESQRVSGVSLVYVAGEPVMVDMSDFDMRAGGEAVVIEWSGNLAVTRADNYDGHRFAGERTGIRKWNDWHDRKGEGCIILGRVIARASVAHRAVAHNPAPSGKGLLSEPAPQCRGRRAPFKADILRLIDEGKSNRDIARATGATYQTVTHWRRSMMDSVA